MNPNMQNLPQFHSEWQRLSVKKIDFVVQFLSINICIYAMAAKISVVQ